MTTKPKIVSFFSGAGGLDIGFQNAGFDLLAAMDIDQDCCTTLEKNAPVFFSEAKIIKGDICTLTASDICDESPDFIIGGPPCQTFSAIGRRAGGAMGTLDPRGNLFKHYCRILDEFKPKGFLFENVRGIISSHQGKDWENILGTFGELGFKLKFRILDAAAYGVPQHRERLILVGYKENEFFFPRPTHGHDALPPQPYFSPRQALSGLKVDEKALFRINGKYDHLIKDIPPGMNYLFYTAEMGHPNPCFAWRSKFSDFLYKAHPDHPVKTIVARLGRYSGPFHWTGRALAIQEFKRLQGFPDDYIITGTAGAQLRQIGNSVAPPFARALALAVKKTIFEHPANIALINDYQLLSFDKRKALKAQRTRSISGKTSLLDASQLKFEFNDRKTIPTTRTPPPKTAKFYFKYASPTNLKTLTRLEDGAWEASQKFNNGDLTINLSKKGLDTLRGELTLKISFVEGTLPNIKSILINLITIDEREPFVIWDIVNGVIEKYSSYPSILELYGHFTEPNPRFKLDFFCSLNGSSPNSIRLMEYFSNFKSVNELHNLKILKTFGLKDSTKSNDWVRKMRDLRFDIRTNATNGTISPGMFRCCYPFTLPIKKRSFIVLNEVK